MADLTQEKVDLALDGWTGQLQLVSISGQIVRRLQAAGCVVVRVDLDEHGRLVISEISDPELTGWLADRPLDDLTGSVVSQMARGWAQGARIGAPDPWIGVGMLDSGVSDTDADRAVRLRYRLAPHQHLRGGAFILIVEALPVSRQAREELGFVALRQELETARLQAVRPPQDDGPYSPGVRRRLSVLAHELRTPLSAMVSITELLVARDRAGIDAEMIELLNRSSISLLSLLNRTLHDLLAEDDDDRAVSGETFDLRSLVDDVAALWSASAARKGVRLERIGVSTEPRLVRGDPGRLRQVLDNLLSNALKFTDAGVIRLTVNRPNPDSEPDHYRFIVEDSGPGLSDAARRTLFERGAPDGPHGGAGLGLHITREIISSMGGRIRAEAAAGGGTRMVVEAPLPGSAATR